jgi:hypothetical protein
MKVLETQTLPQLTLIKKVMHILWLMVKRFTLNEFMKTLMAIGTLMVLLTLPTLEELVLK